MCAYHLTAIAIAFAAGFGVNQFFFSSSTAKATIDTVKSSSIDVSAMHVAGLPVQKLRDLTFVFSDGD
jgi:hypothetical protein